MNEQLTNKKKVKFEMQTFISIVIFVFGLGVTWANLNANQNELKATQVVMLDKLDKIALNQEQMIATRDSQHSEIDKQFAWISPTVHTLAKRFGLE